MYIEKLSNGHYRYQMQFVEERTGKRKRVSVTLAKNTDKAKREAAQILAEKVRVINSDVVSSGMTFGELSESFLNARKAVLKIETIRRYTFSLKVLKSALGDDTRIDKLSARYVSERFAATGRPHTSLNELLRTFKTVLRWAYKNDYIQSVEWLDKLERYPDQSVKEKNAQKYLEKEELSKLLPELKIDLERFIVEFLALSGLRIGECLALQKSDVDFAARAIRVSKTLDLKTCTLSPGAKTYSSNRNVYMQDELFDLCQNIRKYMLEKSLQCGFRTEFFFSDFDGRPLQYYRVNKYFKENCERVIGRPLTMHSLRHTHTSLMFEAGASLDAVSLRLGHSNSRITTEIYLHITEKKKEQYNQQFDRIKILS